jgi:hypothetical protein
MMSKEKFDINKAVSIVILCAGLCSTLTSYATAPKNEIKTNSGTIIQPELKLKVSLPTESEVVRETEKYAVPSALLTAHPEFKTIKERNLYRTVGGVRLQITITDKFINEKELAQLDKLEWKISKKGRLCKDYKYTKDNGNCTVLEANSVFNKGIHPDYTNNYKFYWEPEEWTTDLDAEVQLLVTFKKDDEDKKTFADKLVPFVIKSRVIKSLDIKGKQTQGSDVQMLEEMLWQLGISPQFSDKGKDGARIGSDRGGSAGKTKSCDNKSTSKRYKFYSGWATCPIKNVSTEGMIRRFQGRSFDTENLKGLTTAGNIDGTLNSATLKQLKKVWSHYSQAINGLAAQYTDTNLAPANWVSAQTMLTTGGTIPYVDSTAYSITATYTTAEHTNTKINFPAAADTITIEGILRAWIFQESDNIHWGAGKYQRTDYRMYEGAGDEEGSMGFNHIVWKRLYGPENACNDLRGYIADISNVNMYIPVNSLYGLVVAGSQSNCNWANGLYRSYSDTSTTTYKKSIPEDERPKAYCFETTASNSNCISNGTKYSFSATEDAGIYLLGKAMVGYNAGTGTPVTHYFGDSMLLSTRQKTKAGDYMPTKFGYWMSMKNNSQKDNHAGYIPYMNFIWASNQFGLDVNADTFIGDNPATAGTVEGLILNATETELGMDINNDKLVGDNPATQDVNENILKLITETEYGVDLNKDGRVGDDPLTQDVNEDIINGISETGVPWCYAYGEKDWMLGISSVEILQAASETNEDGLPQVPVGRITCKIGS